MTSKPHLLMVDDSIGDLGLVQAALNDAAVAVEFDTAADGLRGQEHLQRLVEDGSPLPKVVLLDLNMPRMDGRKLLAWIRSMDDYKDMPVIVFTSSNEVKERTHCMAMGANDYWVKPSSYADYARLVARLIVYLDAA